MDNIKAQITNLYGNFKKHWKIPPKGRDMSFKEIAAVAFGGFGVKFVITCFTAMILGIGNTLIGNTIGIPPMAIGIIYAVSVIISFPLGALRANMIDRSRLKKGKYRPFILYMGIPTVILGSLFVWMPYDSMSLIMKCITVLAFNIGFQFFYMFYFDAYDSIPNVLSSNTIERSDVQAIRSVVANFSPTVINAILPFVALWITGEENNLVDISIYRIFYPVLLVVGFAISMLIYVGTNEKIVEAKTHKIKIKLSDSFRAIAKNKYFWIIAVASSTALLETAYVNLLFWMYTYQSATTMTGYSIITLIYGNASLWPMMLAPIAIRLFGKKKLLIYSNLLNIIFIMALLPIMLYGDMQYMIWIVLVCMFINSVATMLGGTLAPSMQGDVRDYQQYISGERMDGIFVYLTLIANFMAMLLAFILLYLQEAAGLNAETAISLGFSGDNVYDVLYNEEYFRKITSLLIIVSAGGALLNVIPYFFYDLTEEKQRSIVSVLRIRAFFEDYGNGNATDEKLVETVDIINSAIANKDAEKVQPTKDNIKTARLALKEAKELNQEVEEAKAALKKAKKAYRDQIAFNKSIDTAKFVYKEINKYNTIYGKASYARAVEIVSKGIEAYTTTSVITIEEAKAMPKTTQDEKDARKLAISQANNFISSKKLVDKHFGGSITRFDESRFNDILDPLNQCEKDILELYKAQIEAKETKNTSVLLELQEQLVALKAKRKELRVALKNLTNEQSLYIRAARPFIEAETLIKQQQNYSNLEEVLSLYDTAKASLAPKAE